MKQNKISDSYELLSYIDLKEDFYADCWTAAEVPLELKMSDFKTISLYFENQYKHLAGQKEAILLNLRKLLDHTRFIDNSGLPLSNSLTLFFGFEISAVLVNLDAAKIIPKLKTVVAYPTYKIRKTDCEGGLLLTQRITSENVEYKKEEILAHLNLLLEKLIENLNQNFDEFKKHVRDLAVEVEVEHLIVLSNKEKCKIKSKIAKALFGECIKKLTVRVQLVHWIKVINAGVFSADKNIELDSLLMNIAFLDKSELQKVAYSAISCLSSEYVGEKAYSIHFSMPSFIQEITDQNLKANVLVHEVGHLIDSEFACTQNIVSWTKMFENYLKSKPYVLGNYSATHIKEFFAVSCECFFQNPVHLQKQLPDVYESLKEIYKQEPKIKEPIDIEMAESLLSKIIKFKIS